MVLTRMEALLWLPTTEGSVLAAREGKDSLAATARSLFLAIFALAEMLLQDEARFGYKQCWSSGKLSHDAAALQYVLAVRPVIK